MSHIWVLFFPVNGSCHTYEWVSVMSHIWMSECFSCHTIHVTHVNEWVLVIMSHQWMRECFSSLWRSHVTHTNEESPENVFQVRSNDRMKEQRWDDFHTDVCCSVLQRVSSCSTALQCVVVTLDAGTETKWLPHYLLSTRCQELSAKEPYLSTKQSYLSAK